MPLNTINDFFSIFWFVSVWYHSTHKCGSNLFIQPLCTHSCTSFHSVNWPGSFLISFPLSWLIPRDKSHLEVLEQKRPLWDNLGSLFDRQRKWGKVICPWAPGQIQLTEWLNENQVFRLLPQHTLHCIMKLLKHLAERQTLNKFSINIIIGTSSHFCTY